MIEKLGDELQVGSKVMIRGSTSQFRDEIQLNADEIGIQPRKSVNLIAFSYDSFVCLYDLLDCRDWLPPAMRV